MNHKSVLCFYLSFLLLLCLSCTAYASERTEEIVQFTSDCPESIITLLREHGYADRSIVCGAAMIRERYDDHGMPMDWSMAALIVEAGQQRQFLGLQWIIGTDRVVIETNDMLGMELNAVIAIVPTMEGESPIHQLFSVRMLDGSSYDLYTGFGNSWSLYRYTSPAGEKIALLGGEFDLGGERHYTLTNGWLKNPNAILDFPKSHVEAREIATQSWEGVTADGRALVWGANLREEATASSRSLGKYTAALAEILDEKPGKTHPWYHVRIGETTGWVSGAYVSFVEDKKDFAAHDSGLEYATVLRQTALYRCMDSNEVTMQLSPQVQMQVLAYTEDGWLHVLVTEGGLNLHLDADGVYGYVRSEDVAWTKWREE